MATDIHERSRNSWPFLPRADVRLQVGQGIWLYLLLMEWTTPDGLVRSGASVRAEEFAEVLGVGERQARRQLQQLRRAGYVELQNTGRGFQIRLTTPVTSTSA